MPPADVREADPCCEPAPQREGNSGSRRNCRESTTIEQSRSAHTDDVSSTHDSQIAPTAPRALLKSRIRVSKTLQSRVSRHGRNEGNAQVSMDMTSAVKKIKQCAG